ncbi:Disease resistance protein RML1A [Glycine soja]
MLLDSILVLHGENQGIHTFIDDEKLQRGEEITPALLKAIHESRIAITVLSEDYASSTFCLDELATILHCAQEKGMLVIPVFYMVDPYDVRHLRGSYEKALAKQKWKKTIRDGYEYKFIEKIVEQVSREINPVCLHVADYPVGLESQVLQVRWLLDVGTDDGVHMLGFHGMGGVLLVLDDVDRLKQLQEPVGRPDWFGPGSIIIISTRDEQLIASIS